MRRKLKAEIQILMKSAPPLVKEMFKESEEAWLKYKREWRKRKMERLEQVKEYIVSIGFELRKKGLYVKIIDENTLMYCDFRKGNRQSYAFDQNGSTDYTKFEEYRKIKAFEESLICKTLDKYAEEERNDNNRN